MYVSDCLCVCLTVLLEILRNLFSGIYMYHKAASTS